MRILAHLFSVVPDCWKHEMREEQQFGLARRGAAPVTPKRPFPPFKRLLPASFGGQISGKFTRLMLCRTGNCEATVRKAVPAGDGYWFAIQLFELVISV